MPPIISLISCFQAVTRFTSRSAPSLGIQPLDQLRPLGGDAPVAPAGLAGAAQVAAHGQQRGRGDIAGVRAQGDGLDHIGGGADAAA